mmetsp:Transcript_95005/g.277816  ORF Transcript_95005/g.277816 Transcript_95005/m.277816 type:complete len:368 (-) Transcript_95005:633-1736(-)
MYTGGTPDSMKSTSCLYWSAPNHAFPASVSRVCMWRSKNQYPVKWTAAASVGSGQSDSASVPTKCSLQAYNAGLPLLQRRAHTSFTSTMSASVTARTYSSTRCFPSCCNICITNTASSRLVGIPTLYSTAMMPSTSSMTQASMANANLYRIKSGMNALTPSKMKHCRFPVASLLSPGNMSTSKEEKLRTNSSCPRLTPSSLQSLHITLTLCPASLKQTANATHGWMSPREPQARIATFTALPYTTGASRVSGSPLPAGAIASSSAMGAAAVAASPPAGARMSFAAGSTLVLAAGPATTGSPLLVGGASAVPASEAVVPAGDKGVEKASAASAAPTSPSSALGMVPLAASSHGTCGQFWPWPVPCQPS